MKKLQKKEIYVYFVFKHLNYMVWCFYERHVLTQTHSAKLRDIIDLDHGIKEKLYTLSNFFGSRKNYMSKIIIKWRRSYQFLYESPPTLSQPALLGVVAGTL